MKNKLLLQLFMLSRYALFGIVLQCFLLSMVLASDETHAQNTSNIKDVYIEVEFDNQQLSEVFTIIESLTGFNFIYHHDDKFLKDPFSLPRSKYSLEKLLSKISESSNLSFNQINKNISVKDVTSGIKTKHQILKTSQSVTITGRVFSENDGEALPGVNIVEKGTSNGTVTDIEGRYGLSVNENATLIFSFVGYVPEEVSVLNRSEINVNLSPDLQTLSEVVVVGYYSQQRRDLTGAIDVVDTDELEKMVATSVSDKLQGRVPGVTVRPTGQPGRTADVVIRGVNNFNATGPLWVIDGLQTTDSRDFNPNDVESIQVIKDASAAALYGARAANGVIVVTTKRGKAGPMRVDFNARRGIENIARRYDLMEADEWGRVTRMAFANNPDHTVFPSADSTQNTDWQDAFIRQGVIQEYDLALSGGTENSNYRISGNYFNQEGTVIGTSFDRYSVRVNGGLKKGRFSIQESVLLSYSKSDEMAGNPFSNAIRMLPVIPVYDADSPTGFGIGNLDAPTLGSNPVAQQRMELSDVESFRMQGSVSGEYKIFDFLKYRLNLGLEFNNSNFFNARKEGQWFWSQPEPFSRYGESRDRSYSTLLENILSYDQTFGLHEISALVGYTENRFMFRNIGVSVRDIPQNSAGDYFFQISQGQMTTGVNGEEYMDGLRSFLANVNYGYAGKYLFSANIRRDGSSKFGPNNKYGNFPSVSAGWRISAEPFFQDFNFISELKIRASYGSIGNEAIPRYRYQAFINTNVRYILGTDQGVAPGSIQRGLANPEVKWNAVNTANIGLDLGLFEDKFLLNFNYYNTVSKDLLVQVPIAWTHGNAESDPPVNVGSIQNKGLELGLTYTNQVGDFNYTLNGNVSRNNNEVLELGYANAEIFGAGNTKTIVGQPIGRYFVLQTDGIFQQEDDIAGSAQPNAQPGDQRFRDVNGRGEDNQLTGEPDGQINADDRVLMGNPWPKMMYSLNFSAGYKGFDFTMFWNGRYKFTAYNGPSYTLAHTGDIGNYQAGLNPWTPENRSTTTPRAEYQGVLRGDSDRFLEDASFLRLTNLQLGYTLPSNLMKRMGNLRNLRVYATGQNLLIVTNYSGLDPDFIGGGILSPGFDPGGFPNVRSYIVGLQLGF